MKLASARNIATTRLNEVLLYLNQISSLEPDPGEQVSQEIKVMRGLFFVLLYGALEKSATDSVQLLLMNIKSLQPKNVHVTSSFNVVTMARKWHSVKDTGYTGAFTQMRDFFSAIEAEECHEFDDSLFANLLQNIWARTIDEVIGAFGMTGFALDTKARVLIDELVEKRNAVAHGRESAASIGEKYRCDDLRKRFNDIQALIYAFIERLEKYFEQREFVRPTSQSLYR